MLCHFYKSIARIAEKDFRDGVVRVICLHRVEQNNAAAGTRRCSRVDVSS